MEQAIDLVIVSFWVLISDVFQRLHAAKLEVEVFKVVYLILFSVREELESGHKRQNRESNEDPRPQLTVKYLEAMVGTQDNQAVDYDGEYLVNLEAPRFTVVDQITLVHDLSTHSREFVPPWL